MAYARISGVVLVMSLAGCVSSSPTIVGYVGPDAVSLIAGEQQAMSMVNGHTTTTRLVEVNGLSTGSGRFNAGSVTVGPGVKTVAVRLWGDPPNLPRGGVESFSCVEFRASPAKKYVFSGMIEPNRYKLSVHEVAGTERTLVLEASVAFFQKLPSSGCVPRQSI
jgi:hypothetical protein